MNISRILQQVLQNDPESKMIISEEQIFLQLQNKLTHPEEPLQSFSLFLQDETYLKPTLIYNLIQKLLETFIQNNCKNELPPKRLESIYLLWRLFKTIDLLKSGQKKERKISFNVLQDFRFEGKTLLDLLKNIMSQIKSEYLQIAEDVQKEVLQKWENEIKSLFVKQIKKNQKNQYNSQNNSPDKHLSSDIEDHKKNSDLAIEDQKEYLEQLKQDLAKIPLTTKDNMLRKFQVQLLQKFINNEQLYLTQQMRNYLNGLEITEPKSKKAFQQLLQGKDLPINMKIVRISQCGLDIFDIFRMIKKGRQIQIQTLKAINNGKKLKIILMFGLSKAGKTTLITRLMGYEMKNTQHKGIPTIQAAYPQSMTQEHKHLIIGASNRSTTRYPRIYKIPTQFLDDDDDDDDEQFDYYLMDVAGLEDSSGSEVQIANRITTLQFLKKVDRLCTVIVINQRNWGTMGQQVSDKLAPITAGIFRDMKQKSTKQSITFVFNNFDQNFKRSFFNQVQDRLYNIKKLTNFVMTDNVKQFFNILMKQSKNPKEMFTVDPLTLDPKQFIRRVWNDDKSMKQCGTSLICDIGYANKQKMKKLNQRFLAQFSNYYQKQNIQVANFYLQLVLKISSEPRFESDYKDQTVNLKNSIKNKLQEKINKLNNQFQQVVQLSFIKDGEKRRQKFKDIQKQWAAIKKEIDHFNQFEKSQQLSNHHEAILKENLVWFQRKMVEWQEVNVPQLHDLQFVTSSALDFYQLFSLTHKQNIKKQLKRKYQEIKNKTIDILNKQSQQEASMMNAWIKVLQALQRILQIENNFDFIRKRIQQKITQLIKNMSPIKILTQGKSQKAYELERIFDEESSLKNINKLLQYLQHILMYPEQLIDNVEKEAKQLKIFITQTIPLDLMKKFSEKISVNQNSHHEQEQLQYPITMNNQKNLEIKELQDYITSLVFFNKIQAVKKIHGERLSQKYSELQNVIQRYMKKFEKISKAVNENNVGEIRRNIKLMKSQFKQLNRLIQATGKENLKQQFNQLKDQLGESISNFIQKNQFRDRITLSNSSGISKAQQMYEKLKQFGAICTILQNSIDLQKAVKKSKKQIVSKIKEPVQNLKDKLKQKNIINIEYLLSYLSYIDNLYYMKKIFDQNELQQLQDLQREIKKTIKDLFNAQMSQPLQDLKTILSIKNFSLSEAQIDKIEKILENNNISSARKAIDLLYKICHQKTIRQEYELDDQLYIQIKQVFRQLKDAIITLKEKQRLSINTYSKIKIITQKLSTVECIQENDKIFKQLYQKICEEMKVLSKDDIADATRLCSMPLNNETQLLSFNAQEFRNLLARFYKDQTNQGKQFAKKLENFFSTYKSKMIKILNDKKLDMLDEDKQQQCIKDILFFLNKYLENQNKVKQQADISNQREFYKISQITDLKNTLEDIGNSLQKIVIGYQKSVNSSKTQQIAEKNKYLSGIQIQLQRLNINGHKIQKIQNILKNKGVNRLSKILTQKIQQKKECLTQLKKAESIRGYINNFQGNFVYFYNSLAQNEKKIIQTKINEDYNNTWKQLQIIYLDDEKKYKQKIQEYRRLLQILPQQISKGIQLKLQSEIRKINSEQTSSINKLSLQNTSIAIYLQQGVRFKNTNNQTISECFIQKLKGFFLSLPESELYQKHIQLLAQKKKIQQDLNDLMKEGLKRLQNLSLDKINNFINKKQKEIFKLYNDISVSIIIDGGSNDDVESVVSRKDIRNQSFKSVQAYIKFKISENLAIFKTNEIKANKIITSIQLLLSGLKKEGNHILKEFQSIHMNPLQNKNIIDVTISKFRIYFVDLIIINSLRQNINHLHDFNEMLIKSRRCKEQLIKKISGIVSGVENYNLINFASENQFDKKSKQNEIQEFEKNMQILEVLMNSYNGLLQRNDNGKQIRIEELKKSLMSRNKNIAQQFKNILNKQIQSPEQQKMDKRIRYTCQTLKLVLTKPRKYFQGLTQINNQCKKSLQQKVENLKKQLSSVIKQMKQKQENKKQQLQKYQQTIQIDQEIKQIHQEILKQKQNIFNKYKERIDSGKLSEEEQIKQKITMQSDQKVIQNGELRKKIKIQQQNKDKIRKFIQKQESSFTTYMQVLSQKLFLLKKLSSIQSLFQQIKIAIQKIFKQINKKKQLVEKIYKNLEENDNGLATQIIQDFSIFKIHRSQDFTDKTRQRDNFETILNEMKNNRSLDQDQVDQLKLMCQTFQTQQNKHIDDYKISRDKNIIQMIANMIKIQGEDYRKRIEKEEEEVTAHQRVKLLAKIFALWAIVASQRQIDQDSEFIICYKIHAAQMICILIILCMDTYLARQLITTNRLAQVKTGQGKSYVLAGLSVYFALFGYEVHCACYSRTLSKRDQDEFSQLFAICDTKKSISYGVFQQIIKKVLNQKPEQSDKQNKQIFLEVVIKQILAQKSEGGIVGFFKNGINKFINKFKSVFEEGKTSKKVLIIDESDVLFNKNYYGDTFNLSIDLSHPTITQLFKYIWAQNKKSKQNNSSLDVRIISESTQFKNVVRQFEPLKQVLKNQIHGMIAALQTYKGQIYYIINKIIMYKVEDSLMDVSYRYNTVYAYMEQFEKGNVSQAAYNSHLTINLCIAEFSYALLPKYYAHVCGVTGTLTCLPQYIKQDLKNEYKIESNKLFVIPSVYKKIDQKRQILSPISVQRSHLNYQIVKSLKKEFDKERPILVFFRNKAELIQFYNCNEFAPFQSNTSYITEENDQFQRTERIKASSFKNAITLMTHSFIRGTDFKLYNKKAEKVGGFHAILTYLIDNTADYIQATGRVARQGNPGSFIEIYNRNQLDILQINVSDPKGVNLVPKKRVENIQKQKDSCEQKKKGAKKKHEETLEVFKGEVRKQKLAQYILKKNKFPEIVKNKNKARMIIAVDATCSMNKIFTQLKRILPQIFNDTYQTLKKKNFPACLEMKLVLYRNYNSHPDDLLIFTPFDSQGDLLKKFIQNSWVSGGWGNEAVEVALQHVNTLENIDQIILIGDIAGNQPDQVQLKRNQYSNYETKRLEKNMISTTTDIQLDKLVKKRVKISGFYLQNNNAKQYFEKLSRATHGQSKYVNVYDKNAANLMTELIVSKALFHIGEKSGESNALIKAYKQILNHRLG